MLVNGSTKLCCHFTVLRHMKSNPTSEIEAACQNSPKYYLSNVTLLHISTNILSAYAFKLTATIMIFAMSFWSKINTKTQPRIQASY